MISLRSWQPKDSTYSYHIPTFSKKQGQNKEETKRKRCKRETKPRQTRSRVWRWFHPGKKILSGLSVVRRILRLTSHRSPIGDLPA
jgi:hypothetical protein